MDTMTIVLHTFQIWSRRYKMVWERKLVSVSLLNSRLEPYSLTECENIQNHGLDRFS
jgi:hypothetical protein